MLLVTELFMWWYTAGLRQRLKKISVRLDGTIDYFSMDLLVKTLFAPFRQISAGKVDGSLEVKMRAFVDRLFSRLIGAFVRSLLLVVGGVTIALQAVFALIMILVWLLVPFLPIAGIVLMAIEVKF